MSEIFMKFTETDMKSFIKEQENVNMKKLSYDLKLFKEFHVSEDKRREFQEISDSSR